MSLHLLGLLPEDLVAALDAVGVRCSIREARQVLSRLISDGAPTEYLPEGEVESKPQNPDVVFTAVKKWNSWGAVTIHTIAIDPRITSATAGGNFIRFMRELAALNNGTSLQIGADTHAPPPLPGK